MEQGNYTAAALQFSSLGSYRDSREKKAECTRLQEQKKAGKQKKEQEQRSASGYAAALSFMEDGLWQQAADLFAMTSGYMDSDLKYAECLAALDEQARAAEKYTLPGAVFLFGCTEQDGNAENGSEPIEWTVLSYDSESRAVLAVSTRVLEFRRYSMTLKKMYWQDSALRAYLNGSFLNSTFTAEERSALIPVLVSNGGDACCAEWQRTSGGPDTEDTVFLLSYGEAERLFCSDEARVCYPTRQAVKKTGSSDLSADLPCQWWLRSPGALQDTAAYAGKDGAIGGGRYTAVYSANGILGIRPAILISIDEIKE